MQGSGPLQQGEAFPNTGESVGDPTIVTNGINPGIRPGGGIGPPGGGTLPPAGGGGGPITTVPPARVGGLGRFISSDDFRCLVGGFNYASQGDQCFFVISGSNYAVIMPNSLGNGTTAPSNSCITSVGANFQFVPYRAKLQAGFNLTTPTNAYWMIGTNGCDQPFILKRGQDDANHFAVYMNSLNVVRSDQYADPLPVTTKRMVGCQSICSYAGSMVWGGFRMRDQDPSTSNDEDNYDEFIAFSDVGTPHLLATTAGVLSTIRIGDSQAEPVTCVTTTTVATDAVGIKGQLLVFTGVRVAIFDGLPPQTQNPTGVNFGATVLKNVGCNAPMTVCQTPHGVVFLGSDNFIYLIRGVDGPVRIGRAVEPMFRGMTPRQQRQCAAVWDPKGFYKISYPDLGAFGTGRWAWLGASDPVNTGHADADVPDQQLWADCRRLNDGQPDLNVKWYGPMTGMKHSCYILCNGPGDRQEIYAGSAVDGSIFECNREDLTTDPSPTDPRQLIGVDPVGITGLYDLGDAHQTKLVTGMEIGVGTNVPVVLESSIIMAADTIINSKSTDFENVIVPQNDLIGDTFVTGTSALATGDTFEPISLYPPDRIRGSMFRFVFRLTKVFWISSTAANAIFNKIDFKNGGVTYAATVPDGYYSGTSLAAAAQAAMRATNPANAGLTVTYDKDSYAFTFAGGTAVFQLLFGTGANVATSPRILMGFTAGDQTGALSYTSNDGTAALAPANPNGLIGRNYISDLEFRTVPINRRK